MGNTQRSLEMEEGNQELKNEKGKKTDFCKASRKATGVLGHRDVIPVRPAADSKPIPAKDQDMIPARVTVARAQKCVLPLPLSF